MLRKLQLVMSDSGLSGFVWAGQASPVSWSPVSGVEEVVIHTRTTVMYIPTEVLQTQFCVLQQQNAGHLMMNVAPQPTIS